jgi:hypothetical protein
MAKVFALTYEYSYPNNNDGNQSPEEAGGILGLFEDEDDAKAELQREQDSGSWGDFNDAEAMEENCGWSSGGYILSVEAHTVTPSQKKSASRE